MSLDSRGSDPAASCTATEESTDPRPGRLLARASVLALIVAALWPGVAHAHGPVAPIASSFLARVSGVPGGVEAKVIDGDQRMWLQVSPSETVVVLDYRGAPYLRFSRAGVEVNQNSAMYYLNQTPAEVPPSNLGRSVPARWQRVSGAHEYGWHDGRLHALARVARLPGASFVGTWSVPVLVDGNLGSITGGLWHTKNPSIVWFWPIVVLLACVLAARRVRMPSLDRAVARALALLALFALAVGAAGRELHGRPSVSVWQIVVLGLIAAFVVWGLRRLLLCRHGYFFFFIVAVVALWEGVELLPTLLHGFVLAAVPAFVARSAAVLCMATGVGLLFVAFRLADQQQDSDDDEDLTDELPEDDGGHAWDPGV